MKTQCHGTVSKSSIYPGITKSIWWLFSALCLLLVSSTVFASEISWDWAEWSELTTGTICEKKVEIAREIYGNRKNIENKKLLEMLKDDCYLIKWVSIQAIAERGSKNLLPSLHKLLLSDNKKEEEFIINDATDAMILWALAKTASESSVDVIISFLNKAEKHGNNCMIEKALYALGFFETEKSINFLSDYANDKDKFSSGRLLALEMLGSMKNSIAQEFVKKAQASDDKFIRNIAKYITHNMEKNIIWKKDMTELILNQ